MKLICFPHQSRHFYLRPETAILRNGNAFYIPERVDRMEGALALVVKINRLGRHIAPKFAGRYYHETALGFCLYAADVLEQNRMEGAPWGEACSFDYSAPLSDAFRPVLQYPVDGSMLSWKTTHQSWIDTLQGNPIDPLLSYLSQYIFLKMGDLIWIELHKPVPFTSGEEIQVFRNEDLELHFSVQ